MDTITRTTSDEREAGKSLEADAQGVRARLDAMPDATIDDIGTDKLKLRQGDDRDAMIAAVRADAVSKYKFTVVDNPEDAKVYEEHIEAQESDPRLTALQGQYEAQESDPRLTALQGQYDALSGADRTYGGKIRSFDEVLKAVPNVDNLLAEMATLEDGICYFLSEEGELILGDGCAEPLEKTLGWNYHKSRSEAVRVSYVDDQGKVVTVEGDDTEIPEEAKIVSERGLITLEEYRRVNKGQFEKDKIIWTESGKNPSVARYACWDDGGVGSDGNLPYGESGYRGSRRVLRVTLNFES